MGSKRLARDSAGWPPPNCRKPKATTADNHALCPVGQAVGRAELHPVATALESTKAETRSAGGLVGLHPPV